MLFLIHMREKKKIAIISAFPAWIIDPSIPSTNSHYAVWLVSLYEALPQYCQDFEFHWITFSKGIKRSKHFISNGQHFHVFPKTSLRIGQLTNYIRERFIISRILKQIKPDIVHTWGTEEFYGLSAKNHKGKKLLSMQGVLTAYAERAPMPSFQLKQRKFEVETMRTYPIITAESPWAADRCKEIAPNASVQLWEYAANEDFFHVERNISDTPSFLLAGTNTPIKDVPSAIEAFSSPQLAQITLYLAGVSKEQYPNLPTNIIALGRLNRTDMRKYLSSVWGVVHPSLADCCPNIIKEARAMGIPCIVTEECGAKQYVVHGKSGFIIPIKSPNQIIESVLRISQDKNTTLTMGTYDQDRCREALSAQTMVSQILSIYNNILNN